MMHTGVITHVRAGALRLLHGGTKQVHLTPVAPGVTAEAQRFVASAAAAAAAASCSSHQMMMRRQWWSPTEDQDAEP